MLGENQRRLIPLFRYDPHSRDNAFLQDKADQWTAHPALFWGRFLQVVSTSSDSQHDILTALAEGESSTHSFILRIFCCLVLHRLRTKTRDRRIRSLCDAGRRYANIAEVLGTGSLFLLYGVGRSIWEVWLPKHGPVFEDAMKYLVDKGILDLGTKYEQLATTLVKHIEDNPPKKLTPECVWITESPGRRPKKRASQSTKPNAKRLRSNANNSILGTSADNPQADVLGGQLAGNALDTLANGPNSLHVLLTVAQHSDAVAGPVPNHQMPLVGRIGGGVSGDTSMSTDSTSMKLITMGRLSPDASKSSAMDSAANRMDQEQLACKDLSPTSPLNEFYAGNSWDISEWSFSWPPLFNAFEHFDAPFEFETKVIL